MDNGSTDGTQDLLEAISNAGLCYVIHNEKNRYHGPALTQALSFLARKYEGSQSHPWVWILDSDCMIARQDSSSEILKSADSQPTALFGEPRWDNRHDEECISGYSLLFDPFIVWRSEVGEFKDGGDPVGDFGNKCRRSGISFHPFPFSEAGYIIHCGRATLAGILKRRELEHPLFNWAKDHYEPHFLAVQGAQERYAALLAEFENAGGSNDPRGFIQACGFRNLS